MFDMGRPAWGIVMRSVLVFFAVFVGLRLAGKREVGQMTVHPTVPGERAAGDIPGNHGRSNQLRSARKTPPRTWWREAERRAEAGGSATFPRCCPPA